MARALTLKMQNCKMQSICTCAEVKEKSMHAVFFVTACISTIAVALICIFLFTNGFSAIKQIGATNFLLGTKWKPELDVYGIFPMILGSIVVTFVAIVLGFPLGIFTAIYLARFCPKKIYPFCKQSVNLLAGIPSVVYGFFGLSFIVPLIARITGTSGSSMLSASIVLAIMILPTIINVSESAIRSVPSAYAEGALALGSCKERNVFLVELQAAKSGIICAIILGIGRAVGETMAVIMVAGNQAIMPRGLLKGIRTLTANIVLEMGYATGLHREALVATALVLFFFVLVINLLFMLIKKKADA